MMFFANVAPDSSGTRYQVTVSEEDRPRLVLPLPAGPVGPQLPADLGQMADAALGRAGWRSLHMWVPRHAYSAPDDPALWAAVVRSDPRGWRRAPVSSLTRGARIARYLTPAGWVAEDSGDWSPVGEAVGTVTVTGRPAPVRGCLVEIRYRPEATSGHVSTFTLPSHAVIWREIDT